MHQVSNDERINALDNAIASVEMEGFIFFDDEKSYVWQHWRVKLQKMIL